jgi:hypothetical protein
MLRSAADTEWKEDCNATVPLARLKKGTLRLLDERRLFAIKKLPRTLSATQDRNAMARPGPPVAPATFTGRNIK